jgi:hypothetical protein
MSESKEPPRLPDVVADEAGPSPKWLPWLGVGLFCLVALLVALRQTVLTKPDGTTVAPEGAAAAAAVEGSAGSAPGKAAE